TATTTCSGSTPGPARSRPGCSAIARSSPRSRWPGPAAPARAAARRRRWSPSPTSIVTATSTCSGTTRSQACCRRGCSTVTAETRACSPSPRSAARPTDARARGARSARPPRSRRPGDARATASHADEQAVAEVRLEVAVEDLLGRGLDVVVRPLELEGLGLGVVDGVAGARVVVARLADRADADDVLPARAELELLGHHLVHAAVQRQRERLAKVRVPDQRQARQ